MSVALGAIEERVKEIAALAAGVRTVVERPGEKLTDDDLMAVIVRADQITRERVTVGGKLLVTVNVLLYLLVARVEGSGKERELEALDAAKAVVEALPAHFEQYRGLKLDGAKLVYDTDPMGNEAVTITPYEGALYSMIEYTLPVRMFA